MTSPAIPGGTLRNWLLDRAFGSADERPIRQFDLVSLARDDVLYARGDPVSHVLFPYDCLLSVTQGRSDDGGIEVASVGREGLAGIWAAFGLTRWPGRCVVSIPGRAARIPVEHFQSLLAAHPAFALILRAYAAAFVQQVGQTTLCVARHSVEEQCARWLALVHDRVGSADLHVGHDTLGDALGARRASVTVTLGMFARAGLLVNRRLRVSILDRTALVARACDCYAALVSAFEPVHPDWAARCSQPAAALRNGGSETDAPLVLGERDRLLGAKMRSL